MIPLPQYRCTLSALTLSRIALSVTGVQTHINYAESVEMGKTPVHFTQSYLICHIHLYRHK